MVPHIVLEYSDDLEPLPDFREVFASVHHVLADVAGAPIDNSKSRAKPVQAYIADGDESAAMVHLDIRLMEGRTTEQKAAVSQACLDILVDSFTEAAKGRHVQTTVAISDFDRSSYAKDPPGTIA